MRFKAGDRVRCIRGANSLGVTYFTAGKLYIVDRSQLLGSGNEWLSLENDLGEDDGYAAKNFELANEFDMVLNSEYGVPEYQQFQEPKGLKYDSNKAPMDLIPYEALEEIAKVLAEGEKKYGTANWTAGIEMRRLLSAAMRHIGQFNSGEDLDSETNTLHIANAATNLLFAIWMYKNRPDLDNRWAKNTTEKKSLTQRAKDTFPENDGKNR